MEFKDLEILNAEQEIKKLEKNKRLILSYVHLKIDLGDFGEAGKALQDIRNIESEIKIWQKFLPTK